MSSNLKPLKLGVRFNPSAIILVYRDEKSKKLRERVIPARNIDILTDIKVFSKTFRMNEKNKKYFENISEKKLEKILFILQDHLKGYSLKESIDRVKKNENKKDSDEEEIEEEENQNYGEHDDFVDEEEEEKELKKKVNKAKIETDVADDDEDFSF
jgi:centrosomal protein CEP19